MNVDLSEQKAPTDSELSTRPKNSISFLVSLTLVIIAVVVAIFLYKQDTSKLRENVSTTNDTTDVRKLRDKIIYIRKNFIENTQTKRKEYYTELVMSDTTGSNQEIVLKQPQSFFPYAYVFDEGSQAFIFEDDNVDGINIRSLALATKTETLLHENSNATLGSDITLSPDGKYIAFVEVSPHTTIPSRESRIITIEPSSGVSKSTPLTRDLYSNLVLEWTGESIIDLYRQQPKDCGTARYIGSINIDTGELATSSPFGNSIQNYSDNTISPDFRWLAISKSTPNHTSNSEMCNDNSGSILAYSNTPPHSPSIIEQSTSINFYISRWTNDGVWLIYYGYETDPNTKSTTEPGDTIKNHGLLVHHRAFNIDTKEKLIFNSHQDLNQWILSAGIEKHTQTKESEKTFYLNNGFLGGQLVFKLYVDNQLIDTAQSFDVLGFIN